MDTQPRCGLCGQPKHAPYFTYYLGQLIRACATDGVFRPLPQKDTK